MGMCYIHVGKWKTNWRKKRRIRNWKKYCQFDAFQWKWFLTTTVSLLIVSWLFSFCQILHIRNIQMPNQHKRIHSFVNDTIQLAYHRFGDACKWLYFFVEKWYFFTFCNENKYRKQKELEPNGNSSLLCTFQTNHKCQLFQDWNSHSSKEMQTDP